MLCYWSDLDKNHTATRATVRQESLNVKSEKQTSDLVMETGVSRRICRIRHQLANILGSFSHLIHFRKLLAC